MSRFRLSTLAIVLGIVLSLAGPAFTAGQDATPASPYGPFTLPIAPGPELCTLPPRDIAEYQAFVGTPEATDLPPIVVTAGIPADQATIDAVTATMVHFFACINAGDYLAIAGAYTDTGFVEDSGSNGLTQEIIDFIASPPQPVPVEERSILYSMHAVQILAHGRVAAVMELGKDGQGGVDLILFAKEDDRWLIDLWVDETFDIAPNFGEPIGEEGSGAATPEG